MHYLQSVIKTAGNEQSDLPRITLFISLAKKVILMNSFLSRNSDVAHVFHSHTINNKIKDLYEKCLHIVYNNKTPSFKELLEKDGSAPIHNRNLCILATENSKVCNSIAPPILTEIFSKRNLNYELRKT